jgi:predicted nucleic acid-binding protein
MGGPAGCDAAALCSPVNVAEIRCGTRPGEIEVVERLFASLSPVPVRTEIGRRAGEFLARYGKSHGAELGDALMGATAMVHGLRLWTHNRKHFPMSGFRFY